MINKNKILRPIILVVVIIFTVWLGFFLGVNPSVKTLILIMSIDYCLSLSLALTGNYKNDDKKKILGKIGYSGIVKKLTMLLLVGLGIIIDVYLSNNGVQGEYLQDIAVAGFLINELLSIADNAQLIGLKIPYAKKILDKIKNIKVKE